MAKRANRGPRPTTPASNPKFVPSTDKKIDAESSKAPSMARLGSVQAAKERQEKRKQDQRRTQQMYLIGGIVAVAVLLGLLFISANQPADAPIPTEDIARYEGLERGQDEEGFPRLGSAAAPVRVVEFASFGCPGCAQFHRDVYPGLLERVRAGEISFTYIPLLTGEGNVRGAAGVALCADRQGKFWEVHDTLFSWHDQFATNAFNQNRLTTGVRALGLDEGQINGCVNSDGINTLLNRAQGKNVNTTPTIRVNNTPVEANTAQAINAAIDAALANAPAPRVTPVTPSIEATQEATSEAAATIEASADATAEAAATAEATQAD